MNCRAMWVRGKDAEGPIVISSRVRLARNIKDLPFPGTMSASQGSSVISRTEELLTKNAPRQYDFYQMGNLSQVERLALVEEHLISPDLAIKTEGAAAISRDGSTSIMMNEEDHLRIQALLPGFAIEEAWQTADKCDDLLEKELDFAFHEEHGYLTACPTNVGTGMRASVMLHLPALVETRQIGRILVAIGQFGLMARGLYGEGTEAKGSIFQISNQVTCGISEEEAVRNLRAVSEQIVGHEQNHLAKMVAAQRSKVEDRVHRALGLLTSARLLDSNEAMSLLSELRLGVSAGLLKLPLGVLSELLVLVQPGVLQRVSNSNLSPDERDLKRAELVRGSLLEALGGK